MDNQKYKTYKPNNIGDKERYLKETSIQYDIDELQHQLAEKQAELVANKINPDDYIGKWYKYTVNYCNHMFVHIKNMAVTYDGLFVKIHLTLSEPAVDVLRIKDNETKIFREITNLSITEKCFFDKKTFSLVKNINDIPKAG